MRIPSLAVVLGVTMIVGIVRTGAADLATFFRGLFVFILLMPFLAKLIQRSTTEETEVPALRLVRSMAGEEGGSLPLLYDAVRDEWPIPFELTVENTGLVEAKNWQLWFSPQDDTTSIVLGEGVARQEAYARDPLSGRYETILDARSRLQEQRLGPKERVSMGKSNILLRGDTSALEIRVSLNADGMVSQSYMWELRIDKEKRRVHWKDRVLNNEEDL